MKINYCYPLSNKKLSVFLYLDAEFLTVLVWEDIKALSEVHKEFLNENPVWDSPTAGSKDSIPWDEPESREPDSSSKQTPTQTYDSIP